MKEFVLAFPLTIPQNEIWNWMINKEWIASAPTGSDLFLKGIPFSFRAHLRPAHAELSAIFAEHSDLSEVDRKALSHHTSILFLVGSFRNKADFTSTQSVIAMLLRGGALGVAFEHSGTAYMAKEWLDSDSEESMLTWINWIHAKGDLRTFGLEVFDLPDLVVKADSEEDSDALQVLLLDVAEELFLESIPLQTGNIVEAMEGQSFMLRQEAKLPWPKGHPNYNPKGALRLAHHA